jgi:FkbM family methyltransferase
MFNPTWKRLVPEAFKREIKVSLGMPDTEACLPRMKCGGFTSRVAIDVGAYSGEWTRTLLRSFPNARVLMIEPQPTMRRSLEDLCSSNSRLQLATTLVGPAPAPRVTFYENETASSVLRDFNHDEPASTVLPMTTLDSLMLETNFPAPDLIKLDVQGYEIEVLKGAAKTLISVEAVLMEINLIQIYEQAPLAHDAIRYMADRDFRVYDVGTFFRRPYDNALWQLDVIFVRSSSPLVASRRWE